MEFVKSCSSLIHFDKGTPALANEIKESLEVSDVVAKVEAMKKPVMLLLNGETRDKTDSKGKVLPEMILICQNLRNNLQHPNEYILPSLYQKKCNFGSYVFQKRNAFIVFFTCAQECEINYLRTHVNSIPEWGEFLQMVIIIFLMNFLGDNNAASDIDVVVFRFHLHQRLSGLLPTPNDNFYNLSDNSVKLIVLDRLNELKTSHREIMVDMITDTIDIAIELITPRNIDEVVQALKKIVVKTQSTDLEKNGEYRQMLVQAIHSCAIKFPEQCCLTFDVVVFLREIIETNPKIRVAIMTRLLDTFYRIRAARVLLLISEVENGLATIKQCLGDLPFFTVNEGGGGADTSKPSQQVNSLSVSSRRPAILADGTYATQSAASEIALSPPTLVQGSLASPGYLRSLNLTGDFSLEQLEEVQPSKPEVNKASSQALLVMVSMLQLGQSSFLPHLVDNDAYDRIVLCIRLLSRILGDEIRKIWLQSCRDSIFHAQPDDLIDFYHLKSRKGMSQLEVEDEVKDDLKRATGEFTKDGDDANKLNRILQLTGFSYPVYAEAYVTVHHYDIVLDSVHVIFDGDGFLAESLLARRSEQIPVFVKFMVNVENQVPLTLLVLYGVPPLFEWSHIPSPWGAALWPLPLGTGHETDILFKLT
ncbi:hypothetical protein MKW92_000046 [Papaver armeniacum]|nr:hypothetical protein MKW92_000046 [Papaver armeniacum]